MNGTQIDYFRSLLDALRDTLLAQDSIAQDSQKTVELDQQSVGRLSRMDALQQQAMAKATQVRRSQQVLRIDAAFARMEDAEYGYCTDCGEDIPLKRLELDPTVPTCVTCAAG
ncbi:MAG: TraR/DksA family transcriptional regulator [Marinosulfonomonas sp.]|nr:TraR/DksA family transcriptional regulator [Marinosulfonomonas sp.]